MYIFLIYTEKDYLLGGGGGGGGGGLRGFDIESCTVAPSEQH